MNIQADVYTGINSRLLFSNVQSTGIDNFSQKRWSLTIEPFSRSMIHDWNFVLMIQLS